MIMKLMGGSIYWLVLTLVTYCSGYELCSGNKNCICQETGWATWLVRCFNNGNSELTVMMNSALSPFCFLNCHQPVSWSDAEFRPTKPQGKASIFGVFGCSSPDESFGSISQRFGIESTYFLRFSSYQRLGRDLTRHHLSGLRKLRVLDLSRNGLTELTNDLLRDVPDLKVLTLTSNKITSLPREIFGGLTRLKHLLLDDNRIEVLDPILFINCTELWKLNLTKNLLTTLDQRSFHGLSDLTSLYLDDNPLAITSNQIFESLKGLQILHISGCQLSSLPEGLLLRLESLQTLRICDNRGNLTTLPKQLFNKTTSPLDVYLERNRFSRLSENTFRGGIQFRRLVLTGNDFSTLSENIFSDSAEMVLLDLSDNGLTDLPTRLFRGLNQLGTLNLSHNRITSLSTVLFADLYSLRELDLSFNRISQLFAQSFKNLANLRIARFSHNSIRFPEDGQYLFRYCVSLEKLFLDHNNFTTLSIFMWDDRVAPTLQLVDLSYNRLSIIKVENKLSRSMRVVFDLRHNDVQQIPSSSWNRAELVFMLDDNPIHCDCILYDWNKPIEQLGLTVSVDTLTAIFGNATCASPKWMNGTRIADLDWTSFLCRPSHAADEYIRCAEECDCWWRPSDQMRVVDCSSRNLTRVPDRIMEFGDHNISFPTDSTLGSYARRGSPTELRLEEIGSRKYHYSTNLSTNHSKRYFCHSIILLSFRVFCYLQT